MYQVLYRKYRPQKFDDVVGQKIVVKTLLNAIKNEKISHSYIFYGPRGTGKTSLAKIMARTVNCMHEDGEMLCGKCKNCISSSDAECVDIIEIDAASNNGVDEIRELKSKVNLVPSSLKYKVYIIDEVHMLSIGAFNALLKTIEEPPTHSIFILATTEIDKVPETIISRCQTFSFERVSNDDIVKRLRYVADQENIDITDDVLLEIAKTSEGGMRDSLGLLDKLSVYKNEHITLDDFYELNSLLRIEELDKFIELLSVGSVNGLIVLINKMFKEGKNIIQITNQLIYRMTDLIVDYYLTGNLSRSISISNLEFYANFFNEKMFDLKKSEHPNIYFQVMILNVLRSLSVEKKSDFVLSVDNVERKKEIDVNKKNEVVNENSSEITVIKKENKKVIIDEKDICNNTLFTKLDEEKLKVLYEINDIRINNTLAEASKEALMNNKKLFSKFSDFTFDTKIGYLICDIMDGNLRAASDKNVILSYEYDSSVKQNLENIEKIQNVYNQVTGLNVKIALITDQNWEKSKQEYIKNKKNGILYEYKEEPNFLDEGNFFDKKDKKSKSVIEMFGDIIEYE